MGTKVKILSGAEVAALAAKLYEVEVKNGGNVAAGLSPAGAVKAASKIAGYRISSPVEGYYFRENGRRNPLPASAASSVRSLRSAIRKRRDGGGTLGRWESVASAASATLGRPISEVEAKSLYAAGGGDLDSSYTGRGTRVAAPTTKVDPGAAVRTGAKK